MKEPDLEEEALRLSLRVSTLLIERQTLANLVDPVTLTTPSGKTEQLELTKDASGHWTASVKAEELGLYSATDGAHTALINVGPPNPREFLEVSPPPTNSPASQTRQAAQSYGLAAMMAHPCQHPISSHSAPPLNITATAGLASSEQTPAS